jgi:hypothetical protein
MRKKEEERRKKNNGVNSGHYVLHQRVQRQPLAHALRSDQHLPKLKNEIKIIQITMV